MITTSFLKTELPFLTDLAIRAGERILEIREEGMDAQRKADNSPVTRADKEADAMITQALITRFASIPIISEEEEHRVDVINAPHFWLVDPLDGTKNFIKGGNGFTVNIGLIENGTPILGVIYIPAQGILYYGLKDYGSFRKRDNETEATRITCRQQPEEGGIGIISHDHAGDDTHAWLRRYHISETTSASSSQKFCRVAEGAADIYPRTGPTMEWDTAAGHAIVLAAGGSMTTLEETPFVYGKEGFLNGGFIVLGK